MYANPRGNSHKIFSSGGRAFLFLPEDVRATVNARIMVKGDWNSHSKKLDIRSEFEAKNYLRDEQRKEIHGTYILNGGGDTIAVETLTGNIEIRKIKPSR